MPPREGCQGPTFFNYCVPRDVDYGIRVHGNVDLDKELLPARLRMDSWSEPDYSEEDAHHERPVELTGTLTVSSLQPGARYALLRYEDPASVPHRRFLESNYSSRIDFDGLAGRAEFAVSFMSNSTVFFRCVLLPRPRIA